MYADSSDSDDDYLINKLAIGINLDDLKSYSALRPPENGSEYLFSVFDERKKIPKVVSVDISSLPSPAKKEGPDISLSNSLKNEFKTPKEYLPTPEWEQTILKEFSEIRCNIQAKAQASLSNATFTLPPNFPSQNEFDNYNNRDWQMFCFGMELDTLQAVANNPNDNNKPRSLSQLLESFYSNPLIQDQESICGINNFRPFFQTILNIPPHNVEQLLTLQYKWLTQYGLFSFRQAEWIYGVLAAIEKPLDSDLEADLRDIARKCIEIRTRFIKKIVKPETSNHINGNEEGEVSENSENSLNYDETKFFDFITNLNLISFISIFYFGQNDLKSIIYE